MKSVQEIRTWCQEWCDQHNFTLDIEDTDFIDSGIVGYPVRGMMDAESRTIRVARKQPEDKEYVYLLAHELAHAQQIVANPTLFHAQDNGRGDAAGFCPSLFYWYWGQTDFFGITNRDLNRSRAFTADMERDADRRAERMMRVWGWDTTGQARASNAYCWSIVHQKIIGRNKWGTGFVRNPDFQGCFPDTWEYNYKNPNGWAKKALLRINGCLYG
jgi:hypothetical protein